MIQPLFLEILSGPNIGKKIKIQEGLRVGRSKGELIVQDPRISSLHAQVIKHRRGVFVLQDKNSSHKILFKGEKVDKVALVPGIEFYLGDTLFKVSQEELTATHILDLNEKIPAASSWEEKLIYHLNSVKNNPSQNINPQLILKKPTLFNKPLFLEFKEGPEKNREIILRFGPRQIGLSNPDIEIFEPKAPFCAFELIPQYEKIIFKTQHPQDVILDKAFVNLKELTNEHQIRIGSTLILISLNTKSNGSTHETN